MRMLLSFLTAALGLLPLHADDGLVFERDVRPLLKTHCFHCHGEEAEVEGSLDVRLVRLLTAGGDSGSAIVPGNRQESLLYQRIADGEMPPDEDKQLTDAEKEVIGRWIDAGALTARPEPETFDGPLITEEERSHWSFLPVVRPPIPSVAGVDRVRTPVDAFLLSRLEQEGFGFAEDASRATLIRRLSFDLHGLPPVPEEVDRFVNDSAPDAYERLVDRFLASPRYGERWGRHWLDVAGYADSEGYTAIDQERPEAWRYRDYVIESWNRDLPFDRFVVEQLAGDELISSPLNNLTPEDARLLTATGFLRMAPDGTGGAVDDANLAKNDVMAETIKIVSTSLMGLTIGCAQCHDHRYDPIPQADYYAFRAIFEPALDWKNWKSPRQRLVSLYTDADRAAAAAVEARAKLIDEERLIRQQGYIECTFESELAKLPADIHEAARAARDTPEKERTAEQKALLKTHPSLNVSAGSLYLYDRAASEELKALAADAKKIRDEKPREDFVRALVESGSALPKTFLFSRGDHEQPRDEVAPAGLTVVSMNVSTPEIPLKSDDARTSGRRLALARHLTSGTHPLTARAFVNRVWHHHFGRGLVTTMGDFGVLGNEPSHPELLDWLAAEFVRNDWSVKTLHRLMLTSTAYRQAATVSDELRQADPDNVLLGRASLRRLEAEPIRDAALSVSGQLNDSLYGKPVPIMADNSGRWILGIENLSAGRPGAVIPLAGQEFRRSVYVQARRSRPYAVLDTFDWPRMAPNCEVRHPSTVPPQSLMLMNSDFILEIAQAFSDRLSAEVPDAPDQQVTNAWKLALSRAPTPDEQAAALAFLTEQTSHFEKLGPDPKTKPARSPAQEALAALCQMLLSSNEFLYVE